MLLLALLAACAPVDDDGDGAPVDLDCDDGSPDQRAWYPDLDGDGYGDLTAARSDCTAPAGFVEDFTDCDDTDPAIHPAAPEDVCDGVDSDCDGDFDEDAPDATTFYADSDDDGYGARFDTVTGCTAPAGTQPTGTDCDDHAADAHPGGTETCDDDLDNDCDGYTDPGCGGRVRVELAALNRLVGGEHDHVYFSSSTGNPSLAMGGDTDGDGRLELAIGVRSASDGSSLVGRVYLVEAPPEGESTFDDAGVRADGVAASGCAGESVAFLADTDGDGADELAVGAPCGPAEDGGVGAAWVIQRPVDGEPLSASGFVLSGAEDEWAGQAVADAGSVLGTGTAIAVSNPWADEGVVYVLPTPLTADGALADAAAILTGEGAEDHAGIAVRSAGDLDGDGVDDLAIGGSENGTTSYGDGTAWIVHGPVEGAIDLADAETRMVGAPGSWAMVGQTFAVPGDIDGDGRVDLAVAAPGERGATDGWGVVYVLTGDPRGDLDLAEIPTRIESDPTCAELGYSMAPVGDLDGDGRFDLLLGVPGRIDGDSWTGGALLFMGLEPGVTDTADAHALEDRGYGFWAGGAVAAGDLDGDGLGELAVGGIGSIDFETGYRGVVFLTSPAEWL